MSQIVFGKEPEVDSDLLTWWKGEKEATFDSMSI